MLLVVAKAHSEIFYGNLQVDETNKLQVYTCLTEEFCLGKIENLMVILRLSCKDIYLD